MLEPTLELQDVHVDFAAPQGRVEILKGIDFQAYSKERIGIVGSSGAGKTTFMMVAAGLERPSSGSVRVAGESLNSLSENAMTRLRSDHIGIVFQSFHLIASMTALENVMIPLEFAGIKNARTKARDMLAEVGLQHRFDHYPRQLSGGEQQRVALARAVVRAPKLLLADEPTGNLDEENGAMIIDTLFTLSEEKGTTLLLITHDHAIAERCGRRVLMRDGLMQDIA